MSCVEVLQAVHSVIIKNLNLHIKVRQAILFGLGEMLGLAQMVGFILPQLLICGNVMTTKKCFPQKHMINIICHIEKQKITEIINILLLKLE